MKLKLEGEAKRLTDELRGKVSKANKRLKRLEENDLTGLPAYRSWSNENNYRGGERFSSAGTDVNVLRKELNRVDNFLNSKTSLVRGANRVLKDTADRMGIKYNSIRDLPNKIKETADVASKLEQYQKNDPDSTYMEYQERWALINNYAEREGLEIGELSDHLEALIEEAKADQVNIENEINTWDWFDM